MLPDRDLPAAPRGARRPGLTAAVLGAVAAAFYEWVGILHFNTGRAGGFDLGIFSQAAKAWASGHWPSSGIRNLPNLLGDHFSPITAVFGVAWRIWPDPRALVLTQALAMGTSVGLVAWAWLRRRRGPWVVAGVLAIALGKGMTSAAFFDVHETGLGVLAMAVLCLGLLERRAALLWPGALALLLVKEDLGATVVVAAGVWWLLTGRRRSALALAATGVAGLLVAFLVVALVSGHGSVYVTSLVGGGGPARGSGFLAATRPLGGSRLAPLGLFVLAAGVAGLRSPIAALALPTLAWRALSGNDSYWQTYFHYDVILMPAAAFALVDVLTRDGPAGDRVLDLLRRGRGRVTAGGVVAALALAGSALQGWQRLEPLDVLSTRYATRVTPTLQAARTVTRWIPPGSTVAAAQEVAVHLVSRYDVRMLSATYAVATRYVVLAPATGNISGTVAQRTAWLRQVSAEPGVVVHRVGRVVLVDLGAVRPVRLPSG